jgi:hypothetical protein
MRPQHDIGMRGGDGRIEDRTQERASVGHRFQSFQIAGCRLSIQSAQKKTPARHASRGFSNCGRSIKAFSSEVDTGSREENASN